MFLFKKYEPIFDEAEFNDEAYIIKTKKYPEPTKFKRSMATVLTSIHQPINVDFLSNFLFHPDCRIVKSVRFFNQVTVVITIPIQNDETRDVNVKVFGTGTIHMTGCRSKKDCRKALRILINCIKNLKIKVNMLTEGDIKHPTYIYCVDNPDLDANDLELTYQLSNRKFHCNFTVDNGELYNILKKKKYDVKYNPNRVSTVRFMEHMDDSKISYSLTSSGKATVSFGENTSVVDRAYKNLNDILKENYKNICQQKYKLVKA